jgi:hypothetical protein
MGIDLSPTEGRPRAPAETSRQHWIVDIARRAHLAHSELLILPVGLSTEEAWAKTGEVCRIGEDDPTRHVAEHFKVPVAQLSAAESHALKLVPDASTTE